MKINNDMIANTVDAQRQVSKKFVEGGDIGARKVLFLGNSITLHEPKPSIGWFNNWGMAASSQATDYVHRVLDKLQTRWSGVRYGICNVGEWEHNFNDEAALTQFVAASEFAADTVIVRLGENVDKSDLTGFTDQLEKFIDYFAHSASEIIVTGLFWEHEQLESMIIEAARRHHAKFTSIYHLGYDDSCKALGEYEVYGVSIHPNDKGMALIAEAILKEIE